MCSLGHKCRGDQAFFRFRPRMTVISSSAACEGIRLSLRCKVEVPCSWTTSLSDSLSLCRGSKWLQLARAKTAYSSWCKLSDGKWIADLLEASEPIFLAPHVCCIICT